MTLRSDPRPGCVHCGGSGIVSVSKDPDEIAECVCTEVTDDERTQEDRRDAARELRDIGQEGEQR